jgi:hypothetical protein
MTDLINGVRIVADRSAADNVEDVSAHELIHVWRINVGGVTSKEALLEAISKGVSLPDYCSRNWYSLEECLRDFDEGKGWLIIFDQADSLLALPRLDLVTFGSILSDTASFWSIENRVFGALFVGSASLKGALAVAA